MLALEKASGLELEVKGERSARESLTLEKAEAERQLSHLQGDLQRLSGVYLEAQGQAEVMAAANAVRLAGLPRPPGDTVTVLDTLQRDLAAVQQEAAVLRGAKAALEQELGLALALLESVDPRLQVVTGVPTCSTAWATVLASRAKAAFWGISSTPTHAQAAPSTLHCIGNDSM